MPLRVLSLISGGCRFRNLSVFYISENGSFLLKRKAANARGHLRHKDCMLYCITNSRVFEKSREEKMQES